jgi:hypothetical protein
LRTDPMDASFHRGPSAFRIPMVVHEADRAPSG